MFKKFGEFGSVEELNRAAAAQKAEGDREALIALALENGIDKEDAEDYMDGVLEQLAANPATAALGKLKVEKEALGLGGILEDWAEMIESFCIEDEDMAAMVRAKGKSLSKCMGKIMEYAFSHKTEVHQDIIRNAGDDVKRMSSHGPMYIGVPGNADVKRIIREYYAPKGGKGK